MKIFEIHAEWEHCFWHYYVGNMPRLGRIIKIKKCIWREKFKLYFEDGKIEIIKIPGYSRVCYGKKDIHY